MSERVPLQPYGGPGRGEKNLSPYQGPGAQSPLIRGRNGKELVPYRDGRDEEDEGWIGTQLTRIGLTPAKEAVGYTLRRWGAETLGAGVIPFVERVSWPRTAEEAQERMKGPHPFEPTKIIKKAEGEVGRLVAQRFREDGPPSPQEEKLAELASRVERNPDRLSQRVRSLLRPILREGWNQAVAASARKEIENLLDENGGEMTLLEISPKEAAVLHHMFGIDVGYEPVMDVNGGGVKVRRMPDGSLMVVAFKGGEETVVDRVGGVTGETIIPDSIEAMALVAQKGAPARLPVVPKLMTRIVRAFVGEDPPQPGSILLRRSGAGEAVDALPVLDAPRAKKLLEEGQTALAAGESVPPGTSPEKVVMDLPRPRVVEELARRLLPPGRNGLGDRHETNGNQEGGIDLNLHRARRVVEIYEQGDPRSRRNLFNLALRQTGGDRKKAIYLVQTWYRQAKQLLEAK